MIYLRKPCLLFILHCLLQCQLPLQRLLLLHLVVVELGKVVDDDGDGEGHHQHARDGAASTDQFPEAGGWENVSISHLEQETIRLEKCCSVPGKLGLGLS